jgi:hypothetical protein
LVHGLLLIRRQTCHKDRSPAIRHPPTYPVATQASGVYSLAVQHSVLLHTATPVYSLSVQHSVLLHTATPVYSLAVQHSVLLHTATPVYSLAVQHSVLLHTATPRQKPPLLTGNMNECDCTSYST